MTNITRRNAASLPDFDFIKRRVPIIDVALALGLQFSGQHAHCWRTERHQHSDRTASLGFQRRKNLARCFVCDDFPLNPIDLVQQMNNVSALEAAQWIAQRFDVPTIPKNKKLSRPERWHRPRAGVGDLLYEDLVGSGLWGAMSDAERAVFVVIKTFADENNRVTISYRGLARYAGKTSDATIARVLHRLEHMCILKSHRSSSSGLRAVGSYELTPDAAHLQKLIRDSRERLRSDIVQEKEARSALRSQRLYTSTNSFFTTVKYDTSAHFTGMKRAVSSAKIWPRNSKKPVEPERRTNSNFGLGQV